MTVSDGIKLDRPLPKSKCPSFRQFKHVWLKFRADNFAFVRKKLAGEREFTLTERRLLGSHTRKVNRPGQCFEIDAHIADCELVHAVTRRPIDRPTVYLVIDVFSHMIVGVAITLEPPSYIGAALALINTFTDKVDYCKQYGIPIDVADWPCYHLCKSLAADRGELLSRHADILSAAFDIDKEILPGYRPDMKPLVERFFKRLNEKRRAQLPGAVFGPKQRGKRNPKLDARLDVKQYTEIIILTILELNGEWMQNYPLEKAMIAEGVNPVPLEIWKWGIQNRSGKLRQKPKDYVESNLIPRATAEVTRAGIEFRGFDYSLPSNIDENWQLAASNADAKIGIAYDPRLVDAILLCDKHGIVEKYEPCKLKNKHDAHLGWSWREVDVWSKGQNHRQRKSEETEQTRRMANDARIDAKLREAEAQHKAMIPRGLSKTAFLNGSSENRDDARRAERQATPLIKNAVPDTASVGKEPSCGEHVPENKIVQFPEKSRATLEAERLRRLRSQA